MSNPEKDHFSLGTHRTLEPSFEQKVVQSTLPHWPRSMVFFNHPWGDSPRNQASWVPGPQKLLTRIVGVVWVGIVGDFSRLQAERLEDEINCVWQS